MKIQTTTTQVGKAQYDDWQTARQVTVESFVTVGNVMCFTISNENQPPYSVLLPVQVVEAIANLATTMGVIDIITTHHQQP